MKQPLISYLFIILGCSFAMGVEFQVNTRTSRDQANPAIALDANGNFVVVWNSYFDDRSNDIIAQRFAADGSLIENEFPINGTTVGNQKNPDAATDESGNFIVVWQSKDVNDNTTNIFARRYDSGGAIIGEEFQVNNEPNAREPKVAMNKWGAFVVVWERCESWPPFDEVYYSTAQIFESNGLVVGTNFDVYDLSGSRYPDAGMDDSGDFAVVWMQDNGSNVIMAQQYYANGSEKAGAFEISTTVFDTITEPFISMNGNGHFLVTWDGGEFGSFNNIYARRYKFDGTAVTNEFQVNTTISSEQENPDAAINNQREFVIVWNSETESAGNERDILGQRYDGSCNPVGDEFRVNTYVVDDQKYPAVASRDNGEFVTVWQSCKQDSSGYGIFGKMGPEISSADFNGDMIINLLDYCFLAEEWLEKTNPLISDMIDDNQIDWRDLTAFCEQWLTVRYKCSQTDMNGDDKIDFIDYAVLVDNWLEQGSFKGDITGNGIVDTLDLKAMMFHWLGRCE